MSGFCNKNVRLFALFVLIFAPKNYCWASMPNLQADYNKILPGGEWTHTSTSMQQAKCDRTKNDIWNSGYSCGFWIIKYNNMDYLHIPIEEVYAKW